MESRKAIGPSSPSSQRTHRLSTLSSFLAKPKSSASNGLVVCFSTFLPAQERAYTGESELALREAHTLSGKPSVVFIDEIDALCPRRDSRREQDVRIAAQLRLLMESKASSTDVPTPKPTASPPPPKPESVDITKQIPAGIHSTSSNNYMRADGQNTGNFITDRPSTKVHTAPGGGSSLGYLFGGPGPAEN